jgi:hypothetical protein
MTTFESHQAGRPHLQNFYFTVVPQFNEPLRVFRHLIGCPGKATEDLRRDRDDLSGALEMFRLIGQVQSKLSVHLPRDHA